MLWTRSALCACASAIALAPLIADAQVGSPVSATTPRDSDTVSGAGSPPQLEPGIVERDTSGFTLSLGHTQWRGDFGSPSEVLINSTQATARYRSGNIRVTASLPYMRIRSDGAVFAGINGAPLVVAPGVVMARRIRHGFADATLGAAWLVPLGNAGFDLELSGRVKLPTAADSTQLSTGKTDYAVGAELSTVAGRFVPIASASYRIFGDPAGWDIRNGFEVSAGSGYRIGGSALAIVTYEYAERTSAFIRNSHQIVGALSAPVSNGRLRLSAFGSVGLSKGAPDTSFGVSAGVNF
jgi:hypothetical protein